MTAHKFDILLINWVIIVHICAKQPESYQCSGWHDFYTAFLPGLYARANTESYKDLLDKKEQGVQEG